MNDHNWEPSSHYKFQMRGQYEHTHWSCRKCKIHFIHYFHFVPDIREAMKQENVPDKCGVSDE